MDLLSLIESLNAIAEAHEVDPLIFILIYIVSTGPFLVISGWLFHHIRRQRPLTLLFCLWGLCYTAPYLYVLAVGRGLPIWVYFAVAAVMTAGLSLAGRGLHRRLKRAQAKRATRRGEAGEGA